MRNEDFFENVGASDAKLEEAQLLEQVRQALGLQHVIRVCPSSEQVKVIAAAKRLLAHAYQIRQSNINLEGDFLRHNQCLGPF